MEAVAGALSGARRLGGAVRTVAFALQSAKRDLDGWHNDRLRGEETYKAEKDH